MKGVIFVRTFKKKFSMILAVLLVLTSLLSVLPLSVSAAGKNLISNSTKIDLLRPDKDITDVSQTWTWKDGVLTSVDTTREDSNVVFQIEGLDNTKTYCFSGKLKILEFASDVGWYGPRMIFRGRNRDDIENCDYSALCHFQNTEVFVNNFINATTLPYEVANARAKLNTEMEFQIYVSPERTVIYYAGKKRFDMENSSRVQKLPYVFGFWTIGCKTSFYDLSLVEAEMPAKETTTQAGGNTTTAGGSGNTTTAGGSGNTTTAAPSGGKVTTTTTQPVSGEDATTTENGDPVDGTTAASEQVDASTTAAPEGNEDNTTAPTQATVPADGDNDSDGGTPGWLIPVIVVVVVLLAAIGVLYYLMVVRKKK